MHTTKMASEGQYVACAGGGIPLTLQLRWILSSSSRSTVQFIKLQMTTLTMFISGLSPLNPQLYKHSPPRLLSNDSLPPNQTTVRLKLVKTYVTWPSERTFLWKWVITGFGNESAVGVYHGFMPLQGPRASLFVGHAASTGHFTRHKCS